MTINYTTLLGLAKPVTGTESGSWGDVVNDQITSLVEDAIANAASISVTSGNVTLTDNNGSSDQSRMAILLVTGSPGVSRNVVAPSTSKWYIVKNSSNAAIVLKGSATTGVTIPAGAEALAFWNGSDFELAAMIGPSSSTDNAVARFDGTTGKVVQNSAVTIADTTGDITTGGYVFTAAGAVGTPAYSTSGDTNTGMWFPAADTIAFSEGGTEVMRISDAGNVGIGTSSPGVRVDASGQVRALEAGSGSGNGGLIGSTASADGNAGVLFQTNSASRWNLTTVGTAGANLRVYNYALGSTVATFDSSGNLGIGTTSPGFTLDISASGPRIRQTATIGTNSSLIQLVNTGGTAYIGLDNSAAGISAAYALALYHSGAYPITFSTSGTERVRITSGGEVYIAGTTDQGAYNLQVNGTGVWGAGAYVNGSDARLKNNIKSIDSGIGVVMEMRPVTFQYKPEHSKDQSIQPGFIAQELQQAMAGKDYLDGVVQSGPEYLNVAYQNLIPILTKAIQELKTELDSVKAELAALKGA